MSDRERAKQIITEVVRCADGAVEGKKRLYKIFYLAHLYYAKREPDYLSSWPIVRMPHGPGIDRGDELIDELEREGVISSRDVQIGPYPGIEYRLETSAIPPLPLEAIEAIRRAVEFAKDKTGAELEELTHRHSHSWNNAKNGEELPIYADLLSEDEYAARCQRVDRHLADLKELGLTR